jgi:hypothetical protein
MIFSILTNLRLFYLFICIFWDVKHIYPGSRDNKVYIVTKLLVGGLRKFGVIPCRLTDLSFGLNFQKGSVAHDSLLIGQQLAVWVSNSLLSSSYSHDYTNDLIHASTL